MKMLDLGKGFVVNHGVPPAICLMIAPNDMAVVGAAVLAATGDEGACSGVISEISFCFCVIFWRQASCGAFFLIIFSRQSGLFRRHSYTRKTLSGPLK